jgi:hypothetical protein
MSERLSSPRARDPPTDAILRGRRGQLVDPQFGQHLLELEPQAVDPPGVVSLAAGERRCGLGIVLLRRRGGPHPSQQFAVEILLLADQPLEVLAVFLLAAAELGEEFLAADDPQSQVLDRPMFGPATSSKSTASAAG